MMEKKYGLIGKTLSHSHSPFVHGRFGDYEYEKYELMPEELDDFFAAGDFGGFNITIPYKQTVMKYCDEISEVAAEIGCVNVIVKKDGRFFGDNTDYYGLSETMRMNGMDVKEKKVLILGTGATSLTAETFCKNSGASKIVKVSRTGDINYDNVYTHSNAEIIINTTPAGMYPNNQDCLLELSRFSKLRGVMDVVPNPLKSRLILQAEELSVKHAGGLSMLVCQAKKGSELFTGNPVPDILVYDTIRALTELNRNVVLIGMPGAGKSSIGKILAGRLSKEFIDIDEEIEKAEGTSVSEIFDKKGEAYFREAERTQIEKYGKEHGLVLATGGGAVLNKENILNLRQNGYIFYIKRDIGRLEMQGRPLSQNLDRLKELYEERKTLYEANSDKTVSNNGQIETAAEEILDIYNNIF